MAVGNTAVHPVIARRGEAKLRIKGAEPPLRRLALRNALERLAQKRRIALVQHFQRSDRGFRVGERLGLKGWRGGDDGGVKSFCLAHGKLIVARAEMSKG